MQVQQLVLGMSSILLFLPRPFPVFPPTRRFRHAKCRLSKRKYTHRPTKKPTHTIAHSQTSKMSWQVCSLSLPLPPPIPHSNSARTESLGGGAEGEEDGGDLHGYV